MPPPLQNVHNSTTYTKPSNLETLFNMARNEYDSKYDPPPSPPIDAPAVATLVAVNATKAVISESGKGTL